MARPERPGVAPPSPALDESSIRNILLEHQLLFSEAQTRARWGLAPSRLRRWKRERKPWRVIPGPREWLLVALWQAGERGVAAAELVEWLDYHEHARYSPDEIAAWLAALVDQGLARREGSRWVHARAREDFVF